MMQLHFDPQDTLFFREARPMEAQGVKPLAGAFPPPPRTVAGAVRSLLGESRGVNWHNYRNDPDRSGHTEIDKLIGRPDDAPPGPLQLVGPYPALNGKRLYQLPASLMVKGAESDQMLFTQLRPGSNSVKCDLGNVRLPEMAVPLAGAKSLEDAWLTENDFKRVLAGETPVEKILKTQGDLIAAEPRLGITLDPHSRSTVEGKLYQTVHSRVAEGVSIGVSVTHSQGESLAALTGFQKLGGEGRFVHVRAELSEMAAPVPAQPSGRQPAGIMLVLLTAASFDGWVPPDFTPFQDADGCDSWQGMINDISLEIICAAIGKSRREGGWNLQAHAARAAESLIPAGSVYFCRLLEGHSLDDAVKKLSGARIGLDTALGRGELAAGYWFE